jgi:hypothetical protein
MQIGTEIEIEIEIFLKQGDGIVLESMAQIVEDCVLVSAM